MIFKKQVKKIKTLLQKDKDKGGIDKGSLFITVFLFTLIFGAFLFVGGTLPTKIPKSTVPIFYKVKEPPSAPTSNSLQMHWLRGVTDAPAQTTQTSTSSHQLSDCAAVIPDRGEKDRNRELVWNYRIAATSASNNQESFQVFYNDASPLRLGTTPMQNSPVDYIANPPSSGRVDISKISFSPALYITDITNNPNDESGDGHHGGVAQHPTDVYGAWKIETGTNPQNPNADNLGEKADPWPSHFQNTSLNTKKNWSAEIIWKLSSLKTKDGQSLQSGHSYRLLVTIYDGSEPPKFFAGCFTTKL